MNSGHIQLSGPGGAYLIHAEMLEMAERTGWDMEYIRALDSDEFFAMRRYQSARDGMIGKKV